MLHADCPKAQVGRDRMKKKAWNEILALWPDFFRNHYGTSEIKNGRGFCRHFIGFFLVISLWDTNPTPLISGKQIFPLTSAGIKYCRGISAALFAVPPPIARLIEHRGPRRRCSPSPAADSETNRTSRAVAALLAESRRR